MARSKERYDGIDSLLARTHRAPIEEPACLVVDAVHELLGAAAKGGKSFAAKCQELGLVQYGTSIPSDVGILNYLQPLRDAAFHSRKHRQAEESFRGELEYREANRERDEAERKTARAIEQMDRIDARYKCAPVSIATGMFSDIETGE